MGQKWWREAAEEIRYFGKGKNAFAPKYTSRKRTNIVARSTASRSRGEASVARQKEKTLP